MSIDFAGLQALGSRLRRLNASRKLYRSFMDFLLYLANKALLRRNFFGLQGREVKIRLADSWEPLSVRLGTSDFWVVDELFRDGEYDDVSGYLIGAKGTIIDAGANIGVSVRLWLGLSDDLRVVGIEPQEENHRLCLENVRLTQADHRCEILKAGLGRYPGAAKQLDTGQAWAVQCERVPDESGEIRIMGVEQVETSRNLWAIRA